MGNPVKMNSMRVLVESSTTDLHNIEGVQEHVVAKSILEAHKSLVRLDKDIVYTLEAVPVFAVQEQNAYLIEYDNLVKYMDTMKKEKGFTNEEVAIKAVCEHNSIPMERTFLVLESEESYRRTVADLGRKIKASKDPVEKNRLRVTLESLNNKLTGLMENENIHLLRKPNKLDVYVNECEDEECEDEDDDDEYLGSDDDIIDILIGNDEADNDTNSEEPDEDDQDDDIYIPGFSN